MVVSFWLTTRLRLLPWHFVAIHAIHRINIGI
jgi:hypothetical protein